MRRRSRHSSGLSGDWAPATTNPQPPHHTHTTHASPRRLAQPPRHRHPPHRALHLPAARAHHQPGAGGQQQRAGPHQGHGGAGAAAAGGRAQLPPGPVHRAAEGVRRLCVHAVGGPGDRGAGAAGAVGLCVCVGGYTLGWMELALGFKGCFTEANEEQSVEAVRAWRTGVGTKPRTPDTPTPLQALIRRVREYNTPPIPPERVLGFPTRNQSDAWLVQHGDESLGGVHFSKDARGNLQYILQVRARAVRAAAGWWGWGGVCCLLVVLGLEFWSATA